jgi:hypothetical protein
MINKKEKINKFLDDLSNKWHKEDPDSLAKSSVFVLDSLDESINLAEEFSVSGKDKKEVVLFIMSTFFENVLSKSMPAYLYPFEKIIRVFLIKVVLSASIDFMVKKYNEGSWTWRRKESINEK